MSTEPRRPAKIREWPHAWVLAVATVCFGAFMGQLDASIVTLTFRPLERQFHAGLASVEWVSLSYLLSLVALVIPLGRWSDRRGRKLSYIHGFVLFTAASAACGLAPSLSLLIAARVVQGVGAALLQANSVALVSTSAPAGRLRAALGIQAGAQAIGLALGPTLGGIIVATVGWRWVYALNVPVGLFAAALGVFLLPRTLQRSRRAGLDVGGAALLAVCATSLLMALSAASSLNARTSLALLLVAVAIVSGWRFVRRLQVSSQPLIDLELLRNRCITAGLFGALFGYLALFGPLVVVPIVLEAHGVSPITAGIILTVLPTGFALAATLSEPVLPRAWTDQRRSVVGTAISAAAIGVGIVVPLTTWTAISILAFVGVGLGTFIPANNAQIMRVVPAESAGAGGGMINMARGFGTALGIATVTLGLDASSSAHSPRIEAHLAFLALLLSAALALLSAAVRDRPGVALTAPDSARTGPR